MVAVFGPWRRRQDSRVTERRQVVTMEPRGTARLAALGRHLTCGQASADALPAPDPETGIAYASLELPGRGATPERVAFLGACRLHFQKITFRLALRS